MSTYTPIQAGRIYELIADLIEKKILDGELKAGDRLPSERELAEQLMVSRTAVREAMKVLAQQGLVDVQRGRGTFIVDDTFGAVRQSLDLLMRMGQGNASVDLVEVREILEPEIAALAAERALEEHIAAMRAAIESMDANLGNASAFISADNEFHLALAEGTQNAVIVALTNSIVELLNEQRRGIFLVDGGPQRGQVHHQRILEAVIRRDADMARSAMHAHLQQIRDDGVNAVTP